MLINFFFISLCTFGLGANKEYMRIRWIYADISIVDENYFNSSATEILIMNVNDTLEVVGNITYIEMLPSSAKIIVRVFGLTMGQFTAPVGGQQPMDLCDMRAVDDLLSSIYAALGITQDNCPPHIGTYEIDGYVLPMTAPAGTLIENKYMGRLQIAIEEKIVLSADITFAVSVP